MSRRNLATLDRDIAQMTNRTLQEAMAHGIENDMIYGGLLTGQSALQGLRSVAATQNCLFGTRRVTWDGDVFRYAHPDDTSAAATIYLVRPGMGCKNGHDPGFLAVTGGVVNARAVGDSTLNILLDATTGAAHWFGTAYNMVGARVVLAGMNPVQQYRIIAHGVGATGATITITLDGTIPAIIAATTMIEITPNAYTDVQAGGSLECSVVGVPNAPMPAGYNGWIQTWGVLWVTPGITGVGEGNNDRTVVFHDDGSIHQSSDHTWGATDAHQYAGFIVHRTAHTAWSNPPFIMLQISP